MEMAFHHPSLKLRRTSRKRSIFRSLQEFTKNMLRGLEKMIYCAILIKVLILMSVF